MATSSCYRVVAFLTFAAIVIGAVDGPLKLDSHVSDLRGGFSALSSAHLPPPGSLYQKSINLPFLGQQTFELSISCRSSTGHLKIDGAMVVDADINYEICATSGSVLFLLPEVVQQMLRRFRTKLIGAKYVPETDTIVVKVLPPLPRHINIAMKRIT
jgi:hypothetical protein